MVAGSIGTIVTQFLLEQVVRDCPPGGLLQKFRREAVCRRGPQVDWMRAVAPSSLTNCGALCEPDGWQSRLTKVEWKWVITGYFLYKGGKVASSSASPAAATRANPQRGLELALAAARTAADNRGENIVVLDTRKLTSEFDYFVIVTGNSRRQLHAISEEIDHVLEDDLGDHRLGIEGYQESHWILLDYGSIVVHLFDDERRAYYRLEDLWAEAPRIDLSHLRREGDSPTTFVAPRFE